MASLAPLAVQQFLDASGAPRVGAKLFTYLNKTSTKTPTYTTAAGTAANTNPIVLDGLGDAIIWLDPAITYTFSLASATDSDPPTSPIWTVDDITAPASGPGSVPFVTPMMYGAKGDGVNDDTIPIETAIATGIDVAFTAGDYKISHPISVANNRQTIFCEHNARVLPNYDGDVFRVVGELCQLNVFIAGDLQPAVGALGGGVVIGYGGVRAWKTSVAGSRIDGYYGHGIVWEQGPGADFTRSWMRNLAGDGYRCTNNYDDNNHGYFADTEATNCVGYGYRVMGVDGVYDNPLNSRHHVFLGAKAYGNPKNFHIQTLSNWGAVFSEAGGGPDEYTTWSSGNKIEVIETRVARVAWVDNGLNNQIGGFDAYQQYSWRVHIANTHQINNMHEGRWNRTQTADRTFEDNISATSGIVTVSRKKGAAAKRTDIFEDRLQLPSGNLAIPLVVNQSTMGTQAVATNGLANGASATFSVNAATFGIGSGDTVLLTPANASAAANFGIDFNYYICFTGAVLAKLTNNTGAALTADTVVRIVVLKHAT